jgi:hypothetical protein
MAEKQVTPSPFFGFPQPILDALDREIQYIDRIVTHTLEENQECPECGWPMGEHASGWNGPICPHQK